MPSGNGVSEVISDSLLLVAIRVRWYNVGSAVLDAFPVSKYSCLTCLA